jgi:hypothetical protein
MLAGNLISGPDTPGTQIETDGRPVDIKSGWLNVGMPCPSCMLFGMADPVAEPQRFSADITFDCQFITSFRYFTNSA